jgi:hypothetical protein
MKQNVDKKRGNCNNYCINNMKNTTKNDVTGDALKSKVSNKKYIDNYDLIQWNKPIKKPLPKQENGIGIKD